jgi:glycosyltransferase involved in cell wall biosynthesis
MRGKLPKISIIVPTYNSSKFIKTTLEYISTQNFKDFELIISDDGSTDETPQIIKTLGVKCLIIENKNSGPAIARNRGIEASSGEYIAYCDHDDLLSPDHIEILQNILDRKKDLGMVYARSIRIAPNGERTSTDTAFNKNLLEYYCYITPSLVMHRRECLDTVGFWDETPDFYSHADMEFFLRMTDRFKAEQSNSISVIRRVLQPNAGFATSLRTGQYFKGLSILMAKRFSHFSLIKRPSGIIAPFTGYYFNVFFSQVISVLRLAAELEKKNEADIIRSDIAETFKELARLDKRNAEAQLLTVVISLLTNDEESLIKEILEKNRLISGSPVQLPDDIKSKIEPILRSAASKPLRNDVKAKLDEIVEELYS